MSCNSTLPGHPFTVFGCLPPPIFVAQQQEPFESNGLGFYDGWKHNRGKGWRLHSFPVWAIENIGNEQENQHHQESKLKQ
jgi:hypothetical protein